MSMKDLKDFNFTRVYAGQILDGLSADPCFYMARICMIKKSIFGFRIVEGKNIKLKDLTEDNVFGAFEKRGVEES